MTWFRDAKLIGTCCLILAAALYAAALYLPVISGTDVEMRGYDVLVYVPRWILAGDLPLRSMLAKELIWGWSAYPLFLACLCASLTRFKSSAWVYGVPAPLLALSWFWRVSFDGYRVGAYVWLASMVLAALGTLLVAIQAKRGTPPVLPQTPA